MAEVIDGLQNDYPLIPFGEIDPEARELALMWVKNFSEEYDWIEHKHKLASDIMNYARRKSEKIEK